MRFIDNVSMKNITMSWNVGRVVTHNFILAMRLINQSLKQGSTKYLIDDQEPAYEPSRCYIFYLTNFVVHKLTFYSKGITFLGMWYGIHRDICVAYFHSYRRDRLVLHRFLLLPLLMLLLLILLLLLAVSLIMLRRLRFLRISLVVATRSSLL